MEARWSVVELTQEQEEAAALIASSLSLRPLTARLLVRRGVLTVAEAEAYLNPRLEAQPSPFLMHGMERAVDSLRYHLKGRKPIMITGDHDVDGVSSVALVHNVLRDVMAYPTDLLHYHIPNGDDEGYGISRNCIDWAKALGCELIIAIDTGIKAIEAVDYARREGLDVIICDHHEADEQLPRATAILNPKQAQCSYPNPHLSGCGVAYKLMQGLLQREAMDGSKLYAYLDLLAISTAADLVPLVGENRAYLIHGLRQLSKQASVGLRALLDQVHIYPQDEVDISSIVYKIAPRLNAAGRMQNGQVAVDLLTASSAQEAYRVCQKIEDYNNERRSIDLLMTQQAEQMVEAMPQLEQEPILIVYRPDWHVGVMGIVAARLAERYRRPALVLTRVGAELIGSGRSSSPVNIYEALESCRDLLKNFGGHKYAAGLTTKEEHLPELGRRIKAQLLEAGKQMRCDDVRLVDAVLPIEEITPELERELALMAPFGLKNERPVFVTERMRDAGGSKVVGRDSQHLRLRMTDRYCKHKPIYGMALGQSDKAKWVLSQQAFGICYTIDEDKKGSGTVHLMVKEIYTH